MQVIRIRARIRGFSDGGGPSSFLVLAVGGPGIPQVGQTQLLQGDLVGAEVLPGGFVQFTGRRGAVSDLLLQFGGNGSGQGLKRLQRKRPRC